MSDIAAPKKEDPQSSNLSRSSGSFLRLRDKIVLIATIVVLIFGLLVWARIEWGTNVFQTAQLWLYQNYGISRAWAFTLAVLAALLVTANFGFLVAAVLLGRRKDLTRLLVISALVLIPGTVIYQFTNRDQCFNRTTEAPLCAVYKKPDGTFVLHRVDDAEPPSTWRKVRTASREDVIRYGASEDDRKMLKPTRITWETCGPGTEFFDSVSGDPKVFFAKIDNRFELFDRPGFHPQVNLRLEPVTVQSVREICRALDAQKAKAEQETKQAELAAQKAKAERDAREAALTAQNTKAERAAMEAELAAQKVKAELAAKEAELAATVAREKALRDHNPVRTSTPQLTSPASSAAPECQWVYNSPTHPSQPPAPPRYVCAPPGQQSSGIATMPTGPTVVVMQGKQRTAEQFRSDDVECRQYAVQRSAPNGNQGYYDSVYIQCMYAKGHLVPVALGR